MHATLFTFDQNKTSYQTQTQTIAPPYPDAGIPMQGYGGSMVEKMKKTDVYFLRWASF